MTAMTANRVGEDRQGLVQGVIASLAAISAILSPLVVTRIFEVYADDSGAYLPGAPFLFSALLIVAILPLLPRLIREGRANALKNP